MVLDVQDSEDQNLIRMFPQCVLIKRLLLSAPDRTDFFRAKEFIDQAIASGGTAFVHCNGTLIDLIGSALSLRRFIGGISLAPSFVIMFIMQHLKLNWEDALHLVQNRRYCISPNGGFLTQIKVRQDSAVLEGF